MVTEHLRDLGDSYVIELPNDDERIGQLERKLVEYEERLDSRSSTNNPPEENEAYYNKHVLSVLLDKKKIDTWEESRILAEKFGGHFTDKQMEMFEQACAVIEDYVLTGGKNLFGGTGLK